MKLPVLSFLTAAFLVVGISTHGRADWDLRIGFANSGWGRITTSPSTSGGNEFISTGVAGNFSDVTILGPSNPPVTLTAHDRNLAILGGGIPNSVLQEGDNFAYNLNLQLGSKFVKWSGTAVNTFSLGDLSNPVAVVNSPPAPPPPPFVPPVYDIFAEYTSGFQSVTFTFNGNPLNSITKNTATGTLLWSEISSFVTVGAINSVNVVVTDETGTANDSFDLDVFSPSAIPEPSSMLLLGAFGAGYVGWRRRRRKS